MKKFFSLLAILVFTVSFTSCATVQSVKKMDNEVAGYNLNCKKDQMHNKILNNKNKTLLATP